MSSSTLLITGASGRVGRAVVREAEERGLCVRGYARAEMDVTDAASVRARFDQVRPKWVVHCAALTDVDEAERDPVRARAVNVDGTEVVAEAAAASGAGLVYLSTDYVFAGAVRRPYRPEDPVDPLSVYGRTKAEGEKVARKVRPHLLVRTSWVFGEGEKGFASAVLRASRRGEPLRVVEGERSRPTLDVVVAACILDLLASGAEGTFHVACRGEATRVALARAIVEASGGTSTVTPVDAEEFGAPAPRPPYSVLDLTRTEKVLGRAILHWRKAVERWAAVARERGRDEETG